MDSDRLQFFLDKFGIYLDDYNGKITEMDFEKLTARYSESEWLRHNVKSFKRICEIYPRIISGYYADKKRVNGFYEWLEKRLKEAER